MSLLHLLVLSHVLDPTVTIPEVLAMLRCTNEVDQASADQDAGLRFGDEREVDTLRPFAVPADYWV